MFQTNKTTHKAAKQLKKFKGCGYGALQNRCFIIMLHHVPVEMNPTLIFKHPHSMVPNGKSTTKPEFMESVWSSILGVSQVSTSLSAFWLFFFPTVWVPNPISIHIIWYLFSEISTMISPFSPVTSQCFNWFQLFQSTLQFLGCSSDPNKKKQTDHFPQFHYINLYQPMGFSENPPGPHTPRLGASRIRGIWGSGLFHDGPSETKLATSRPVMPSGGR